MKIIRNKHNWYKNRGYLHFDCPISLKQAKKIVTDPVNVSKHAFYPFITYEIITKKIYYDAELNKFFKKIKERPIAYASHVDAHMYSYYAFILNGKYEEFISKNDIDDNVLAFRKLNKSNIHFANDAFNQIDTMRNCVALAFDITKFFDTLDHVQLKLAWCKILSTSILPDDHYNVYKSLTQFSKVKRDDVYKIFNISKKNPKKKKNLYS